MEVDISATLKSSSSKHKADHYRDSDHVQEDEDDEGSMNLVLTKGRKGVNLNLEQLEKRAFAGDNFAAEFKAEEKKNSIEEGQAILL